MPPAVADPTKPAAKAAPSPFDHPADYLRQHGFKPLGNPDWPSTLWIDGSKPLFGSEEYVDKTALFLRRNSKTNKAEAVEEPVMANDGSGKQVAVRQLVYTPPAEPMSLSDALRLCMEREHRKVVAEARALARAEAQRQQAS